jgi:hypothetical protein
MVAKSSLTHLQLFWLPREAFDSLGTSGPGALMRELRGQQAYLMRAKRAEAERRERVSIA